MKIKFVVIDLEIPANVKKWGARIGIPAGVLLLGGGIAWAAGLHTWNDGDTLTAADLNGNFSQLQSELGGIQSQITTQGDGGLNTRPPSAFSATDSENGSAVTVPNEGAGSAAIKFDTAAYDLGGELDTSTGTFTPTNTGIYWLSCKGEFFTGQTAAPYAYSMLIKNGSTTLISSDHETSGSNYGGLGAQSSGTVLLHAGDHVTCSAWASNPSGTTLDGFITHAATFSGARIY